MSNKRSDLGISGEQLAVDYLTGIGYIILHRNYRRKFGEIDIIARDGRTLVFAEVKTRSTAAFGPPAAAVNSRKQRQIAKVALDYLAREKLFDHDARFDVLAVTTGGSRPLIDHIPNAFDLP